MSKIPYDLAIGKIDEYLTEINELLKKNYQEGEDDLKELSIRIENFIATCLEDGDRKLERYRSAVHGAVAVAGVEETEEEKQKEYVNKLRKMRGFLLAFKEEIELKSRYAKPRH